MTHTVVVASGGIDSTAAMALHHAAGDTLTAVTVDYGQRHRREIDAARQVADFYEANHLIVTVPALAGVLGGSALTSPDVPVPHGHYAAPVMASTVVPNRNAILANIAVGAAIAVKADTVVLGIHAGDHPIYPDCRPEFLTALQTCVAAATAGGHTPRIDAPFVYWTKTALTRLATALGAPLGITWSCYEGDELHCGRCGTCVERREAFADAGVADPTRYQP